MARCHAVHTATPSSHTQSEGFGTGVCGDKVKRERKGKGKEKEKEEGEEEGREMSHCRVEKVYNLKHIYSDTLFIWHCSIDYLS